MHRRSGRRLLTSLHTGTLKQSLSSISPIFAPSGAARVGFDFETPLGAAGAIAEEARELSAAENHEEAFQEVGDLLFAVVTLARKLKIDPEDALRTSGQRFRARFAAMDREMRERGISYRDLPPEELAAIWERSR